MQFLVNQPVTKEASRDLKQVRQGLQNTLDAIDKELVVIKKQIQQLIDQDALLKA